MTTQNSLSLLRRNFFHLTLVAAIIGPICVSPVRAGLTVDIHTFRYPGVYVSFGYLNTNSIAPAAPLGDYLISSPNGSELQFRYDTNGFNYVTGGGVGTSDFNSFMNALTNGQWSIQVTNASSTNTYYFDVSATGLNANLFNTATITSPANNATNVSDDPTFTWTGGPIGWLGTADVNVQDEPYNSYYENASLPPSATSWFTPNPPLPPGTNKFQLVYRSNVTATVIASIPQTTNSNAISGWESTAHIDINTDDVLFTVVSSTNTFDAYLVARYDFENTNAPGQDSSGNDNSADCGSSGGPLDDISSTNAIIHHYAREYFGDTSICFTPGGSAFPNLSNALSGSFSVTAWIKTTNTVNQDTDNAYFGSPILFAYSSDTNSTIPLTITGSKAAFTIYDQDGNTTTLHSTTTVNDGSYHFLAVTRNKTNGLMSLYVDGNREATGTSTTQAIRTTADIHLFGGSTDYEGLVDDVRIYSTDLTSNDVAVLAGAQPPVTGGGHTNIAHYRFDDGGDLGHDDSGNDNNFTSGSSWGLPLHEYDQVGAAGSGGIRFYGVSSIVHAPPNESFTNITDATANSFSLSLWVKTQEVVGNDTDDALNGAVVIWQYESGTDDIIPVSITGNKVAFHTGDESGNSQTLHSTSSVTDGNYHHIVVTRDRNTGVKKIYVDGVLEATATGTTRVLNANGHYFSIGGVAGHSFDGTVDDAQFYSGVLSSSEVTDLFNNPGSVIPNTTDDGGSTNITVALTLSVFRIQPPGDPEFFLCLPFSTVTPAPITTHEVHSPNGLFEYSNNQPSSSGVITLDQLLNEITNGVWTIYFNKNHASERQFTFNVSAAGVTSNLFQKVTILSPLDGSTNVPSIPTYFWNGASGLQYLSVSLQQTNYLVGATNPPTTATTWINPPPLSPGTNQLDVTYFSIGVTNFSFTMPVDSNSVPIFSWNPQADLQSQATSVFVVGSGITPVQLVNPNRTGENFQFQFLSQSGKTNTVQSRTNLTLGVWINRTNILGDGSTKTVILPVSNKPEEFFRVLTQ